MGDIIMGAPSPFDIGRTVGNNFQKSQSKQRDSSAIEAILSEALSTGTPESFQNSIGQILSQVSPERQGTAVQFLQNAYQNIQKKNETSRVEKLQQDAAQKGGYTFGAPPQVQAAQVRNQAPPKPAGGLSGQAVPEEVGKAIQGVVTSNPSANADQLALAFDSAQIPRAYSNSYIENRRRQDETNASNQRENQKIGRQEELQFHKEGEKYDEDLFKQTKIAKGQVETIDNIDKAIKSGNVKPSSWSNIFKGFGKIGDKISEALLTKDEATLQASIPQLLEGWKDVFGVRLTDADLKLLQDKLPSIGKNPEANNAILKVLRKYADMTSLRGQIAEQIKAANKGLRPLGYAAQVERRFDEMIQPVEIINPNTGKKIPIPAYKLSEALLGGAKLANE